MVISHVKKWGESVDDELDWAWGHVPLSLVFTLCSNRAPNLDASREGTEDIQGRSRFADHRKRTSLSVNRFFFGSFDYFLKLIRVGVNYPHNDPNFCGRSSISSIAEKV